MESRITIKEYRFQQFKKIILILVAVFVLCAVGFAYFKISSDGHKALREGKNVLLAMDMLSVEYSGKEKLIFDSGNADGLTDGVRERLLEVVECDDPQITLISFRKKTKEVLNFTYENENYRVSYVKDDEGEHWSVDYMIHIQHYDD